MKLTKRLFAALAASVALFALAGCGTTSSSNSTSTPRTTPRSSTTPAPMRTTKTR